MKKKIAYMLIGAFCAILLSYGFVAYADQDASEAQTNKTPTASDTYYVPPAAAATTTASTTAAKTAAAQSATKPAIALDQLKALDIKVDGSDVKVHIALEREQAKMASKVEIKRGDDPKQKQYLTGSDAAQFIQQLLAALQLQADMNQQQVLDALVKHFAVQPAKVELRIDLKLLNRPEELKAQHNKEDEDKNEDKNEDKDEAKVQTVKAAPANPQVQLAKDDQLAQQELKKAAIAKKKALQRAWQKAHKEQQAAKKQQKQLVRGDRDDDHHNGKQDGDDDGDQDHDHDGDHGDHQHHGHEEHDDEDES